MCSSDLSLLIVDDDLEVLALLKKFFVQQGYAVEVATDVALIKALGGGYRTSTPEQASTDHPSSPLNLSGDASNERH